MNIIDKAMIGIQLWFNSLLKKEDGDVNIVSIVVLIGIAVLLAILFRGQITALLTSLFGTIQNNAQNAIAN